MSLRWKYFQWNINITETVALHWIYWQWNEEILFENIGGIQAEYKSLNAVVTFHVDTAQDIANANNIVLILIQYSFATNDILRKLR